MSYSPIAQSINATSYGGVRVGGQVGEGFSGVTTNFKGGVISPIWRHSIGAVKPSRCGCHGGGQF